MAESKILFNNKVDTPANAGFNINFVFPSNKDGAYYNSNSVYVPTGFVLTPQTTLPSDILLNHYQCYWYLQTATASRATQNYMFLAKLIRA